MSSSQKLGAFTLHDDTDSDGAPTRNVGHMFSERARLQADLPPPTAAAAVRAAARDADIKVCKYASFTKLIINIIHSFR